jgi:Skp family chaperone for outer membrane proteins
MRRETLRDRRDQFAHDLAKAERDLEALQAKHAKDVETREADIAELRALTAELNEFFGD